MATDDVLIAGHVEETRAGESVLLTNALAERDQAALERSRARILAIADVVVPGHGPAFRPAGNIHRGEN